MRVLIDNDVIFASFRLQYIVVVVVVVDVVVVVVVVPS